MQPKEITRALKQRGGVGVLAERLGVSSPTISQIIHRKRHTQWLQEAIAEAIGQPWDQVFPPLDGPPAA